MHAAASRRFSLSKRLGLDCTKDGLTLAGVPLLHRTVRGFTPRDELEIRWLLERAYGSALDTNRIIKGIETIAHALNEGRLGQATIRALLLDLHELDWPSAARLARADDALAKFDADEPRDERGHWASEGDVPRSGPHGLPPNLGRPPLRLIAARPDDAPGATPVQPTADPQAALDAQHWVSLPDGNRLDELGDLLEWAANATPEEAPRIRAAIKQTYYDVGDVRGGDALNRALSDGLEASSPTEREEILRTYEPFTSDVIDGRHLELVVPLGSGNAAQRGAIAVAAQRASARGVTLSVTHF